MSRSRGAPMHSIKGGIVSEWHGLFPGTVARREKPPATGRQPVTYRMTLPSGRQVETTALTRSEARAEFKRHFRHGKILPGTLIERV